MKKFQMIPPHHLAVLVSLALSLALLHGASRAFAQADPKAAAREHFKKGVAAFEDKRFGEASEEFDAAYKLSPAFVVLYNIGQVNVALGRSVEAVEAFDQYLKQGASTVSASRKQEVQAEIEKQMARIGTVTIETSPAGAEIRLDGKLIGKSPLARPLRVNVGRHTVEAILAGHTTQFRDVDVAGRAALAIALTLDAVVAPTPPPEPAPPPAPVPVMPPPILAVPPAASPATPAALPSAETVPFTTGKEPGFPAREPESAWGWQRIGGLVLAVGGIVTATWGGVEAYHGANQANDAKNLLSMATPTTSDAVWDKETDDFNSGKNLNQRGWITAGIGAAVVVGGVLLIATTPAPERANRVSLAPWMTAEAGGAVIGGNW